MALVSVPSMVMPMGIGWNDRWDLFPSTTALMLMDATNKSVAFIGQIVTSDGGSHTIDTTGSSSIGWPAGSSIFSNVGSQFRVGIAAVDTTAGPPARAVNVADVITFDVVAQYTGGGGVLQSIAWNTSVPTAGTKTIAHGDLVAVCFQLTAKAGSDGFRVAAIASEGQHRPTTTLFTSAYVAQSILPNFIITFSDGALGYFFGSHATGPTLPSRTWNSGSSPSEYGQLFQMPFGMKVSGLYGWPAVTADLDMVLYSDPLGTPVAERTVFVDANTVGSTGAVRMTVMFDSPLIVKPNQPIVAAFKPGGSNISAYYKTLNNAAHRITDVCGLSGYGVQRTTGAFLNANSSLDHYYIGLMASALHAPSVPTYQLGP